QIADFARRFVYRDDLARVLVCREVIESYVAERLPRGGGSDHGNGTWPDHQIEQGTQVSRAGCRRASIVHPSPGCWCDPASAPLSTVGLVRGSCPSPAQEPLGVSVEPFLDHCLLQRQLSVERRQLWNRQPEGVLGKANHDLVLQQRVAELQ